LKQTYPGIEYIVIDGGSTDGTINLVKSYGDRISKFISAPDKGIYDAINKGIKIASGDIVGIVNSDDFFCNEGVIKTVVDAFTEEDVEVVLGDVQFVDPLRTSRVVRYYSSKKFKVTHFRFGYMPAHPGFYAKRNLFNKLGGYKTDYTIAADFELIMRYLLTNSVRYRYLEMPIVSMRTGGISNKSIRSNFILNMEIARACRENGVRTNYFFIYSKYFTKIFQFFGKRITRKLW
jgi:glycosyltransferase involved in cell wall biosynthesis